METKASQIKALLRHVIGVQMETERLGLPDATLALARAAALLMGEL